jgi:hypothetical protein
MKKYYNATTHEWYNEGQSMTRRVDKGVFSGIPTAEQLTDWGFKEVLIKDYEPTIVDKRETRIQEIHEKLCSMDYLTSKFIDGEDMSQYGDWQEQRRQLRKELRKLEDNLTEN